MVRVHGTQKALAITTDCTPRYCYADPYEGGKQAIAEAYRNLCAVGARPLAVTNCLNFGNPQRPEIMAQFVGCLEGMGEACRALDFPIVSGNVSLYNESKATGGGSAILPTPAIGGVGLLEDWEKSATIAFKAEGEAIVLIGETNGEHLGQSLWLREIHGRSDGPPPPVDLRRGTSAGEFVRRLDQRRAGHRGSRRLRRRRARRAWPKWRSPANIGATDQRVERRSAMKACRSLFGEDQGRYIVTTAIDTTEVQQARAASGCSTVTCWTLQTGSTLLVCDLARTMAGRKRPPRRPPRRARRLLPRADAGRALGS